MPYFNKSKGFQLRSGNKANAPFKMMGSSPVKQSASFGPSLGTKNNYGLTTDFLTDVDGNKISKKKIEAQSNFGNADNRVDNTKSKTNKVKPQKIKIADTGKMGNTSSRPEDNATPEQRMGSDFVTSKPKPNKTKATKTKTNKNTASKDKPEATKSAADLAAEKAAKKEERAQAFRDAGEIISNVGDANTSMVSVMQSQADRKTAKADKATARKDKDIQNEKDIANTKRTNQVIAEHTAELNKDSSKLSTDNPSANPTGESSAEKVKNKKTTNGVYADGNDSYTTPDEMLKKSRRV